MRMLVLAFFNEAADALPTSFQLLHFTACGAISETAVTPMMFHADGYVHGFRQCLTEDVIWIVIHERAGIDRHAAIVFGYHFAECTHERATGLFGMKIRHAAGRDLWGIHLRAGRMEFGKLYARQIFWQPGGPKDFGEMRGNLRR